MKRIIKFSTLMIVIALLGGCSQNSTDENGNVTSGVAETQTGAGSMGAVIDGNSWKSSTLAYGTVSSGIISVIGLKTTTDLTTITTETITLFISATATGTYPLTVTGSGVNYASYTKTTSPLANPSNVTSTTYLTSLNSGTVVVTKYDTANKIVSGTFTFTAKNDTKTVSVSSGVFDIKYSGAL